jgi:valyl-tRNA synthetase
MSKSASVYNHQDYEDEIWRFWDENLFFHADAKSNKPPYTILMPPPNVTSQLHMGHGTGFSVQDVYIRWKRMSGFNACWLPGTDHAGIATQMMVEQDLEKQGKTRVGMGRQAFFQACLDWQNKYKDIIMSQFKKMGFSFDPKRVVNTMDPTLSAAVRYVFVTLYKEGLIYRGERLVNWDCALGTAVSDDEVDNEEVNGSLWFFRYPIIGTNEFIPIATTRPETMLGDTAVAVHPDGKFKHFIGKKVKLPFSEREIPIIGDDYVKSEFGTGAVKITPAHDPNDFEIGKRHNLPFISVIDDRGAMKNVPERFEGLDRFVCRKEIIKALKELELFDEAKNHRHVIPHSNRSKTVIEPKLSMQWFVKMEGLAKPAAEAARNGELRFFPELWVKSYLNWQDNIQDWCISRQLWWGHQIPIWYCQKCHETMTGTEDPTKCSKCESTDLKQDPDVLDTWFSSWLWPLSPFGWPQEDEETKLNLKAFFPSAVLVTAPEILNLWVARMVMVGLKFMGKPSFKDVFLTATVCDKKGRKFSKTLGNGIDPLELIELHGADATRFSALSLAPLGARVMMEKSDFEMGAKFINKIWNAFRFLSQYFDKNTKIKPLAAFELTTHEKWLISQCRQTAAKIDMLLEGYRLHEAVDVLYHFIWGSFCDWGIECAKEDLTNPATKERSCSVLTYAFETAMRLGHPFIPFITEKVWQELPAHPDLDRPQSVTIANYPKAPSIPDYPDETAAWDKVQSLITAIRSVRTQSQIPPKEKLKAFVKTTADNTKIVTESAAWIKKLANLEDLSVGTATERPAKSLTFVGPDFEIFLPVEGIMDLEKEAKRLQAALDRTLNALAGIEKKLSNPNFEKAPADVIQQVKDSKTVYEQQKANLEANLKALTSS